MRIRKNAKHSTLLYSHGDSAPLETTFQTHVCQLNQSPWDVIPFASDSNQFEAEDSFTENNGSHVDSIGAVVSVTSMMDIKEKKHKSLKCQETDGKGWQCRKEATPGQSFCRHHQYAMLKSYNHNSSNHQDKKSAASTANARRARPLALSTKSSSSTNPYEFYYYSGFGPSWGRRRGDRRERNNKVIDAKPAEGADDDTVDNVISAATTNANGSNTRSSCGSPYSSPPSQNDYRDDEEEDEDCGKKRMRKPVKARSLKSLM